MKTEIRYRGRLEVRFDTHPPRADKDALKERGFWWDGREGVWHLARPVGHRFEKGRIVVQDGLAYALDLLRKRFGLSAADAAEITRQAGAHARQAGDAGMEEALGIA